MAVHRFLCLTSAALLLACGGGVEPYAPASAGEPAAASGVVDPAAAAPSDSVATARGEGTLAISVGTSVESFLGAVHAVVTDSAGGVVGGVDEDVADPARTLERTLALPLPAGEGYRLSLTAETRDAQPTTCRASVEALSVEADATARVSVFSWDCAGAVGYVPATAEPSACDWLANWAFVARTSAAVGDRIAVAAAAHAANGQPALLRWSTPTPERGSFASPAAAHTSFQCLAAGEDLTLELVASDGGCAQHVTQHVACH